MKGEEDEDSDVVVYVCVVINLFLDGGRKEERKDHTLSSQAKAGWKTEP